MASTQDIITRALRRIRVVGVTQSPPAELSVHGLDALNDLLSAYERGLNVEVRTIAGNTQSGSRKITDLDNTANLYNARDLALGMSVTGTGMATGARIHKINSKGEIELDLAATASGTGVSLAFSAVPFDDSLTEALISVLAVRLAEDFGQTVGPILARDASRGQAQIDGAFLYIPTTNQVDRTLVEIPSSRFYDGSDDLING